MHKRTASQRSQPQDTSTTAEIATTAAPTQIPPEHANGQLVGTGGLAGSSTLIAFLHSVPTPLVTLLLRLAPLVSYLRHVAQMISWQSSWVDSWLFLAFWWALVLFIDPMLRYFLPLAIASAVAYFRCREPPKDASQPITEASVQAALKDLSSLHALLPSFPAIPASLFPSALPFTALVRVCAIAFVPYLVLTYLIPVRVLVGLSGTVVLTYRAPFACLLRAALWRSAFVRWTVYRCWAGLSGIPLPSPIPGPAVGATSANATITAKLRFAFTVYENQRWWMGLDWTAALLPGERPSWCSASQAPLAPPAMFALPAPTTIFLPIDGVPNAREKRTATWAWAEPEWQVVVRRDGEPSTEVEVVEAVEGTDAEGWVYGDNKWESHSGKGGIGKYTRYRLWTRVAFLIETTERTGPGPAGVLPEDGDLRPLDTLANGESKEKKEKTGEKEKRDKSSGDSTSSNERRKSVVLGVVGSGIRQRLQAAVSGSH